MDPKWGDITDVDKDKHANYRAAILNGMKEAVSKRINVNKLYEVRQKKGEDPSDFLGCLVDPFKQ